MEGTVFGAALAGLTGMTPAKLRRLLEGMTAPQAWEELLTGTHPADPGRSFTREARRTDPGEVGERICSAGVTVLMRGSPGYPVALSDDPGAPAVLFALGEPAAASVSPSVAVVGTRSATHYGRRVASEMAADLAEAGVVVVSGLARGIDSAAHAGAVRAPVAGAPPVAVVGTGLDVVYPTSSARLREEVSRRGAILSEAPLGRGPLPWVFPARNRIIAGLADVVVVVECHRSGGSLITAEAADRRGVPVCAVPGSVLSPSSVGTNALLVDGCTPVRDATDVLVAISLARPGSGPGSRVGPGPASTTESTHRQDRLTEVERSVWEAVDESPTVFETILLRTDLSIPRAAEACEALVEGGLLATGPGWWSRARAPG